jgi:hypothetical protein
MVSSMAPSHMPNWIGKYHFLIVFSLLLAVTVVLGVVVSLSPPSPAIPPRVSFALLRVAIPHCSSFQLLQEAVRGYSDSHAICRPSCHAAARPVACPPSTHEPRLPHTCMSLNAPVLAFAPPRAFDGTPFGMRRSWEQHQHRRPSCHPPSSTSRCRRSRPRRASLSFCVARRTIRLR